MILASSPQVSVLLPVRDAMPHLESCIASLGRQTLRDFEVIAVDDGSRDGSGDRLDRWAATDARVRVKHRPAEGLVASLNAGLAACSAPLIARMDADDVAHPKRLELQLDLLAKRAEIGVVSCLVRCFPQRVVGEGYRLYEQWINSLVEPEMIARERFVESPLAHPSVAFRREVVELVGGWRNLGWPEDYDLWLRLAASHIRFSKVPRLLHFWREHDRRLTRRDPVYGVDRFLACKAHHLLEGPLSCSKRIVIWGAGRTGRRLARHLLEGGASLTAFIDIDPRKQGRVVRGHRVFSPERLSALAGPRAIVLSAVASRGARELIRNRLVAAGLREGHGFWCVA